MTVSKTPEDFSRLPLGDAPASAGERVKVLFPLPLFKAYDYLLPPGVTAEIGAFVKAPFGPREVFGVVWHGQPDQSVPAAKLKTIAEVLAAPPLSADLIDFIDWTAHYTMFPAGSVLRMVMRSGDGLAAPASQTGYVLGVPPEGAPIRMTPQRQAVLDAAGAEPKSASALAAAAGVSDAVVRGLAKLGALARVEIDPDPAFAEPDLTRPGYDLSEDQQFAAEQLCRHIENGQHATTLIDGVTGSGKTEVYLEAAAAALARDASAQVVILIPEIALTLPFLKR
ncbi:Helicase PriA essential for oriC/DnaA-independent DNA replication, partial [hydrothermal vent metagenome]